MWRKPASILTARERARGRLAGLSWHGRVLTGRDLLPPADAHYLRHVVHGQEWPTGTTEAAFLQSIRDVVVDPLSGALTCHYSGTPQITIVRRSLALQGPAGFPWVLLDYRVETGHWVIAFQPSQGLAVLRRPERTDIRWLRRPR
jgi:hypothetical protein